jgi:AcrR family transcriptional regulator
LSIDVTSGSNVRSGAKVLEDVRLPEPVEGGGEAASPKKRSYLPAAERERRIVEGAARFFAEHGFEAQTRELAQSMGITHSAIFRYFPTKEALVERVYEYVFVSRWNPEWEGLILDRSKSLEERLTQFYCEYAERIFDYEWVRIFIYAGLKSNDITPRYLSIIHDKLIRPICAELRSGSIWKDNDVEPYSLREEEIVWALHGQIFYIAIRKFIYNREISGDINQTISDCVKIFVRGVGRGSR